MNVFPAYATPDSIRIHRYSHIQEQDSVMQQLSEDVTRSDKEFAGVDPDQVKKMTKRPHEYRKTIATVYARLMLCSQMYLKPGHTILDLSKLLHVFSPR